jgi:hypothetical protein
VSLAQIVFRRLAMRMLPRDLGAQVILGLQRDPTEVTQPLREYTLREAPSDPVFAEFCVRWIASCAALPILRWPFTTAIGRALANSERLPSPNERLYLIVCRLSWFRTGGIPLDIRIALLRCLRRRTRLAIRAELERLELGVVSSHLRRPGLLSLDVGAMKFFDPKVIFGFPDGPFDDPIFRLFMSGRPFSDSWVCFYFIWAQYPRLTHNIRQMVLVTIILSVLIFAFFEIFL